jgi:hypothetical protein
MMESELNLFEMLDENFFDDLLKSSIKPELFQNQGNRLFLNEHTRSKRKKWSWTETNASRANDIVRVIKSLREYWPITERHCFYRLLSDNAINSPHWKLYGKASNPKISDLYGTVGELLKWLRIGEYVPWDAIADETRVLTKKIGYESAKDFIRNELDYLFSGYSRCTAQNQPNHIEIWIEKQTLLHIVKPIADSYCRRVLCCRGYNSITFQSAFNDRMQEALARGLKPVILCFMDWDPSGCNMVYSAMQTLADDFDLDLSKVHFERCGINPEHFSKLHCDPVPIKPTDSRTKSFIKKHGETCYELDALHPRDLQELVRTDIERFTDMNQITCNLDIQKQEREFIGNLKRDAEKFIINQLNITIANE